MRYRLQNKEPFTYWDRTAKPVPVHTYRWVDIAVSDDIEALIEHMGGELPKDYRIVNTEDFYKVVRAGGRREKE